MTGDYTQPVKIIESIWPANQGAIRLIRQTVFIEEQNVPDNLEWDDLDSTAIHLCIFSEHSNKELIAYARLLPEGKLTRMAVAKEHRAKGYGAALVQYAIAKSIQLELTKIKLDAQIPAVPFYQKLGFLTHGDEFWDAGIKHIHMFKSISK